MKTNTRYKIECDCGHESTGIIQTCMEQPGKMHEWFWCDNCDTPTWGKKKL